MMPPGAQVLSHFLLSHQEHVAFVLMVGHGCKMATSPPVPVHIMSRKKRYGVSSMPAMFICFQKAFLRFLLGTFGLIFIDSTWITWLLLAVRESRRVSAFSWPIAIPNKIRVL